jgi:SAM-dependent methyltransferase
MVYAFEGMEDPSSFPDRASLELYRSTLLANTASQVDFLIRHLPAASRVLEIGCGNGRLLIELARRQAIQGAVGIDLATSRVDFARSWARDERLKGLRFDAADALQDELPDGGFTAVCCITGAFGYFDAIAAGAAAEVARRINSALQPEGLLCLEIYSHPAHRRLLEATGRRARIWTELPPHDPWRFYLSDLSLDETGETLTHGKTFIHRTSGRIDAGRWERLHLYTEESLTRLLLEADFCGVRMYEGWSTQPYEGGEIMVVTALRPSPT